MNSDRMDLDLAALICMWLSIMMILFQRRREASD